FDHLYADLLSNYQFVQNLNLWLKVIHIHFRILQKHSYWQNLNILKYWHYILLDNYHFWRNHKGFREIKLKIDKYLLFLFVQDKKDHTLELSQSFAYHL